VVATQVLHELCACYLILTLTATSLAKLRRWRSSSLSVMREQVIPLRAAVVVTIAVALLELTLSTLLVLEIHPLLTGCITVSLFFAFGCYRLAVAARTRSLMCACAGSPQYSPATFHAVMATVVSFLFMISVACCWTFVGSNGKLNTFSIAGIVAWVVPFAILFVSLFGRQRRSASDEESRRVLSLAGDSSESDMVVK
jgi:hypothetical protein